jgi:hypothetical protein
VLDDVVEDDEVVLAVELVELVVPVVDDEVVVVVLGPVPSASSSQPGRNARAATRGIRTNILIEPPPTRDRGE